ncbi:protein ORF103 [Cyprinid herpesvirus 1]|uniref:Protein ORF103 n=1 Tax=Cyprinid herpesvirus 1 TaxID=317858 RepID=K7PCL2_9VIRU|nr:protein ORF103 [Cyprinid herpesvirus 1]AFJ20400.1 protein ORF103 [Cyprinid herpesvirus 1]
MDCICGTLRPSVLRTLSTSSMASQSIDWSLCCSEARWASSPVSGVSEGISVSELEVVGQLSEGHWLPSHEDEAIVELGRVQDKSTHLCHVRLQKGGPSSLERIGITHCAVSVKCLVEKVAPQFYLTRLTGADASAFFGNRGLPPTKAHASLRSAASRLASYYNSNFGDMLMGSSSEHPTNVSEAFFDTGEMRDQKGGLFRLLGTLSVSDPCLLVVHEISASGIVLGKALPPASRHVPFYPLPRTPGEELRDISQMQVLLAYCSDSHLAKVSLSCIDFSEATRSCTVWSDAELWTGYSGGFAYGGAAIFWKPLRGNFPLVLEHPTAIAPSYQPVAVYAVSARQFPCSVFSPQSETSCAEEWRQHLESGAVHWESVITPQRVVTGRSSHQAQFVAPAHALKTSTQYRSQTHIIPDIVADEQDESYRLPGDDTLKCVGLVCAQAAGASTSPAGGHGGGSGGTAEAAEPSPPVAVLFASQLSETYFGMQANPLCESVPASAVSAHTDFEFRPCSIEHLPNRVDTITSSRSDLSFPFWRCWDDFCTSEPTCVVYTFHGQLVYIQVVVDKCFFSHEKAKTFGLPTERTYSNPCKRLQRSLRRDDVGRSLHFWYQKSSAVTGHLFSDY